ncbi:MAG: AAA domain-containing protein [Candidatus Omnitrophota bacterium]
MSKLKQNMLFKLIAVILIQAFLCLDISWAANGDLKNINTYLAPCLQLEDPQTIADTVIVFRLLQTHNLAIERIGHIEHREINGGTFITITYEDGAKAYLVLPKIDSSNSPVPAGETTGPSQENTSKQNGVLTIVSRVAGFLTKAISLLFFGAIDNPDVTTIAALLVPSNPIEPPEFTLPFLRNLIIPESPPESSLFRRFGIEGEGITNDFCQGPDNSVHVTVDPKGKIQINFANNGNSQMEFFLAPGLNWYLDGVIDEFSDEAGQGIVFNVRTDNTASYLLLSELGTDAARFFWIDPPYKDERKKLFENFKDLLNKLTPEDRRELADKNVDIAALNDWVEDPFGRIDREIDPDGNLVITLTRKSYDGKHTAILQVEVSPESPVVTIKAWTDYAPLTPLSREEIFKQDYLRYLEYEERENPEKYKKQLEPLVRTLEFLVYKEKMLTGSWRFLLRYPGRDALIVARALKPILQDEIYEMIIQNALDTVNDQGEVLQMEAVGEHAAYIRVEKMVKLLENDDNYKISPQEERRLNPDILEELAGLITAGTNPYFEEYDLKDDNLIMAIVVAEYLQGLEGQAREEFLSQKNAREETNQETILRNWNFILTQAEKLIEAQADETMERYEGLISIDADNLKLRMNWWDWMESLARGKYAFDVNCIWMPQALSSILETAKIVDLDMMIGTAGDLELSTVSEFLNILSNTGEDAQEINQRINTWQDNDQHFLVHLTVEEWRDRLRNFYESLPKDHPKRDTLLATKLPGNWIVEQFVYEGKIPRGFENGISYPALALDAKGNPIAVMHNDLIFRLWLKKLPAEEILQIISLLYLPYAAGGLLLNRRIVASNPMLDDERVEHPLLLPDEKKEDLMSTWKSLDENSYHGIVWPWLEQVLLLSLNEQSKQALSKEELTIIFTAYDMLFKAMGFSEQKLLERVRNTIDAVYRRAAKLMRLSDTEEPSDEMDKAKLNSIEALTMKFLGKDEDRADKDYEIGQGGKVEFNPLGANEGNTNVTCILQLWNAIGAIVLKQDAEFRARMKARGIEPLGRDEFYAKISEYWARGIGEEEVTAFMHEINPALQEALKETARFEIDTMPPLQKTKYPFVCETASKVLARILFERFGRQIGISLKKHYRPGVGGVHYWLEVTMNATRDKYYVSLTDRQFENGTDENLGQAVKQRDEYGAEWATNPVYLRWYNNLEREKLVTIEKIEAGKEREFYTAKGYRLEHITDVLNDDTKLTTDTYRIFRGELPQVKIKIQYVEAASDEIIGEYEKSGQTVEGMAGEINANGKLQNGEIIIKVNGKDIRSLAGVDTLLEDGDVIEIRENVEKKQLIQPPLQKQIAAFVFSVVLPVVLLTGFSEASIKESLLMIGALWVLVGIFRGWWLRGQFGNQEAGIEELNTTIGGIELEDVDLEIEELIDDGEYAEAIELFIDRTNLAVTRPKIEQQPGSKTESKIEADKKKKYLLTINRLNRLNQILRNPRENMGIAIVLCLEDRALKIELDEWIKKVAEDNWVKGFLDAISNNLKTIEELDLLLKVVAGISEVIERKLDEEDIDIDIIDTVSLIDTVLEEFSTPETGNIKVNDIIVSIEQNNGKKNGKQWILTHAGRTVRCSRQELFNLAIKLLQRNGKIRLVQEESIEPVPEKPEGGGRLVSLIKTGAGYVVRGLQVLSEFVSSPMGWYFLLVLMTVPYIMKYLFISPDISPEDSVILLAIYNILRVDPMTELIRRAEELFGEFQNAVLDKNAEELLEEWDSLSAEWTNEIAAKLKEKFPGYAQEDIIARVKGLFDQEWSYLFDEYEETELKKRAEKMFLEEFLHRYSEEELLDSWDELEEEWIELIVDELRNEFPGASEEDIPEIAAGIFGAQREIFFDKHEMKEILLINTNICLSSLRELDAQIQQSGDNTSKINNQSVLEEIQQMEDGLSQLLSDINSINIRTSDAHNIIDRSMLELGVFLKRIEGIRQEFYNYMRYQRLIHLRARHEDVKGLNPDKDTTIIAKLAEAQQKLEVLSMQPDEEAGMDGETEIAEALKAMVIQLEGIEQLDISLNEISEEISSLEKEKKQIIFREFRRGLDMLKNDLEVIKQTADCFKSLLAPNTEEQKNMEPSHEYTKKMIGDILPDYSVTENGKKLNRFNLCYRRAIRKIEEMNSAIVRQDYDDFSKLMLEFIELYNNFYNSYRPVMRSIDYLVGYQDINVLITRVATSIIDIGRGRLTIARNIIIIPDNNELTFQWQDQEKQAIIAIGDGYLWKRCAEELKEHGFSDEDLWTLWFFDRQGSTEIILTMIDLNGLKGGRNLERLHEEIDDVSKERKEMYKQKDLSCTRFSQRGIVRKGRTVTVKTGDDPELQQPLMRGNSTQLLLQDRFSSPDKREDDPLTESMALPFTFQQEEDRPKPMERLDNALELTGLSGERRNKGLELFVKIAKILEEKDAELLKLSGLSEETNALIRNCQEKGLLNIYPENGQEYVSLSKQGRVAYEDVKGILPEPEPLAEDEENPEPKERPVPKDVPPVVGQKPSRPDDWITSEEYTELRKKLDDLWWYGLKALEQEYPDECVMLFNMTRLHDRFEVTNSSYRPKGDNRDIAYYIQNTPVTSDFHNTPLCDQLREIEQWRRLDFNKENGAKELKKLYSDLAGLSQSDLWDRFPELRPTSLQETESTIELSKTKEQIRKVAQFLNRYVRALEYRMFFERMRAGETREVTGRGTLLGYGLVRLSGVYLHFWRDQNLLRQGDNVSLYNSTKEYIAQAEVIDINGDALILDINMNDHRIETQLGNISYLQLSTANGMISSDLAELRVLEHIKDVMEAAIIQEIPKGYENIFRFFGINPDSTQNIAASPALNRQEYANPNLYDEEPQREAVESALSGRNTAVESLYGSGKTAMAIEIIYQLVKRNAKVLVSAPTHVAIDKILKGVREYYVNVVRLVPSGRRIRIDPEVEQYVLEPPALNNNDEEPVRERTVRERRRNLVDEILEKIGTGGGVVGATPAGVVTHGLYNEQLTQLRTAAGRQEDIDSERGFQLVIADEAIRFNLPQFLTLLLMSPQIVLFGDPEQIGPFERFNEIRNIAGLSEQDLSELNASPYEMLLRRDDAEELGFNIISFERSFRSHPILTALNSKLSYQGKAQSRRWSGDDFERLNTDFEDPILEIIDTSQGIYRLERRREDPVGTSYRNPGECELVLETVDRLIKLGYSSVDIAITPPHRPQVVSIIDAIRRSSLDREDKINLINRTFSADAYAGEESRVVIIPFSRSNPQADVGFLKDRKRLNTWLTRAQEKLVLIGDFSTLTKNPEVGDVFRTITVYAGQYLELFSGDAAREVLNLGWSYPSEIERRVKEGTIQIGINDEGKPFFYSTDIQTPALEPVYFERVELVGEAI